MRANIDTAYFENGGKRALIHCFISADAQNTSLDEEGKVKIQMMNEKNWLNIQRKLEKLEDDSAIVWAIFDCDRNNIIWPKTTAKYQGLSSDEEDKEDEGKYGTIFTYAAMMGQPKPDQNVQTFCDTITEHMTDFMQKGNGKFSLVQSLL